MQTQDEETVQVQSNQEPVKTLDAWSDTKISDVGMMGLAC